MCLDRLDQVPYADGNIGYKIIRHYREGWGSVWQLSDYFKMGVWISDKERCKLGHRNNKYLTGFHIFTEKNDAMDFVQHYRCNTKVVLVKYKNVTATGYQRMWGKYMPIVVARKMYIIGAV